MFIFLHFIAIIFFWPALFITIPLHIIAGGQKTKLKSEKQELAEIKELLKHKEQGKPLHAEMPSQENQHATQSIGTAEFFFIIGAIIFFAFLFWTIAEMK